MNESSEVFKIVKTVLNEQRDDANMASEAYRESLAKSITQQVETHIKQLIEDIVSPCGIPSIT